MIALTLFVVGLVVGYFYRDVTERIKYILSTIQNKKLEAQEDTPKSLIVEALTPEQEARKEMEERVKRLNGGAS